MAAGYGKAVTIAPAKAYGAAIMQRPTRMLRTFSDDDSIFSTLIGRVTPTRSLRSSAASRSGKTVRSSAGIGVSGATRDEDPQICDEVLSEAGYDVDFGA